MSGRSGRMTWRGTPVISDSSGTRSIGTSPSLIHLEMACGRMFMRRPTSELPPAVTIRPFRNAPCTLFMRWSVTGCYTFCNPCLIEFLCARWYPNAMNDLGDRIRQARERVGLNQSELGRRLGVRSQTINQWESGTKAPSRENFAHLVQIVGVDATWLLYGAGGSEHNGNHELITFQARGRRVPRLTIMEVVQRNAIHSNTETAFANFPCGLRAYAFDLPNDSCAPDYPRGSLWIVDPDRTPTPGAMVVAIYGEPPRPVFGEYRQETSTAGVVHSVAPLNARWPSARSDLEPLEVLAVMTESTKPAA